MNRIANIFTLVKDKMIKVDLDKVQANGENGITALSTLYQDRQDFLRKMNKDLKSDQDRLLADFYEKMIDELLQKRLGIKSKKYEIYQDIVDTHKSVCDLLIILSQKGILLENQQLIDLCDHGSLRKHINNGFLKYDICYGKVNDKDKPDISLIVKTRFLEYYEEVKKRRIIKENKIKQGQDIGEKYQESPRSGGQMIINPYCLPIKENKVKQEQNIGEQSQESPQDGGQIIINPYRFHLAEKRDKKLDNKPLNRDNDLNRKMG